MKRINYHIIWSELKDDIPFIILMLVLTAIMSSMFGCATHRNIETDVRQLVVVHDTTYLQRTDTLLQHTSSDTHDSVVYRTTIRTQNDTVYVERIAEHYRLYSGEMIRIQASNQVLKTERDSLASLISTQTTDVQQTTPATQVRSLWQWLKDMVLAALLLAVMVFVAWFLGRQYPPPTNT